MLYIMIADEKPYFPRIFFHDFFINQHFIGTADPRILSSLIKLYDKYPGDG